MAVPCFPGIPNSKDLPQTKKEGKSSAIPSPQTRPTLERYPSAPASPVGPMGDFLGDGSATFT